MMMVLLMMVLLHDDDFVTIVVIIFTIYCFEVHRMDYHYVLDFVIGNSWGVMGLGNLKVLYTHGIVYTWN